MITERTLRQWRKDALKEKKECHSLNPQIEADKLVRMEPATFIETQDRILRLTQELLDQHLLRKG